MVTAAPLVVPALKKHTATVIWAHGLGDSGAGWMPIAENFRRRGRFSECAFVFPNAPSIPITVNFGMEMPGWYDIVRQRVRLLVLSGSIFHDGYRYQRPSADRGDQTSFGDLAQIHDQPGILKSRDYFNSLIKVEIEKGIPSSRIVLGGFSQGGAISIFTGVICPDKLAGIFGLSSYLLLHNKIKDYVKSESTNKDTPIFMGHGDADPMVRHEWGLDTSKVLKEMGWMVDFRTYKGLAHSADPKEIDDLEKYLEERLPPLG